MIKVGVIRGGMSSEYENSLATGANVLSHLRRDPANAMKYKIIDILIDTEGLWHMNGLPISLDVLSRTIDVVVNALHGEFGEDGKVQQLLGEWGIPYTGSNALASAVGFNKALAKEAFKKLNIKTPQHFVIPPYQADFDGDRSIYAQKKATEVFQKLSPPWILRPLSGGTSFGVHVCTTLPELLRAFQNFEVTNVAIIVEELIAGREASVNIVEKFRGKELYTLPSVEVRAGQHICPGNFSTEEKKELERLAQLVHKGLYLDHYSRIDFIVTPHRGMYVLKVNTLPWLIENSFLPKSLTAIGATMPEFIDHIIELALAKK